MNFDGFLIFSLSKDWTGKFTGIQKFSVKINNNEKSCIILESSIRKKGRE